MDSMKAHTEVLHEEKLKELSSKPNTSVLKYVHDKPEATMPDDQQYTVYRQIVAGFDAACRAYPAESDECVRERVLNSRPEARLFQRLYCKTFAASTVRARNTVEADNLDRLRKGLLFMLSAKAAESSQESASDREARVMNACMLMAMREARPEDYDTASKLEGRTVVDATTGQQRELPPNLTPIDHRTLGPSTVNQGGSSTASARVSP
jgi:hypothetical protein